MVNSQNGFPASSNRDEIGVQTFTVPGTAVRLPVRADIAKLLLDMAQWFGENIEALRPGECFGYAFRPIVGSQTISNHGSGTAIDLNAPSHPLGKRGTVPDSLRGAISAKARSLGLRWGGDFTGRVDEMHFEVNVSLAEALRLAGGGNGSPERPTVRRGARGDAVRELQGILNRKVPDVAHLAVDGIFGPLTEKAVLEFQRREHIGVDGIVGPITWKHLLA
jgi:hypothetical protein